MLKFLLKEKMEKLHAKKPKIAVLEKRVRHPFQIINISSYPFWIGFSLFWIMTWFGLFYLNAEWANNALKGTFFDYPYYAKKLFVPVHTRIDNVHEFFYYNDFINFWGMYCELYIHSWWFEIFCKIITVPIISIFQTNSFEIIILNSACLLNIIYPFLYWFFDGLIDSLVILYINFTWIMQTNIFDDFFCFLKTSEVSFWSLAKFIVPLSFAFQLGCPFKFFSIGITAKLLTTFVWLFTSIGILIIATIVNFCQVYPLNITIFPLLMLPFVTFISVGSELFLFYLLFINYLVFPIAVVILLVASWRWMSDISIEAVRGEHTRAVQKNLIWGAYLFMLTEVIIFITLFQTAGYFYINPSAETSQLWEFPGIHSPYSIGLGFANLILLLNSGWMLQIARKRLNAFSDYLDYKRGGNKKSSILSIFFGFLAEKTNNIKLIYISNTFKLLQKKYSFDGRIKKFLKIDNITRGFASTDDRILLATLISNCANYVLKTIILGVIFMTFQFIEYSNLSFSISSGIYGTCFYCITGLHGFHVIVGLVMLSICYYQFKTQTFVLDESIFFWFSVRYWQFVDAVWGVVWLSFYFTWDSFELLFNNLLKLFF